MSYEFSFLMLAQSSVCDYVLCVRLGCIGCVVVLVGLYGIVVLYYVSRGIEAGRSTELVCSYFSTLVDGFC